MNYFLTSVLLNLFFLRLVLQDFMTFMLSIPAVQKANVLKVTCNL